MFIRIRGGFCTNTLARFSKKQRSCASRRSSRNPDRSAFRTRVAVGPNYLAWIASYGDALEIKWRDATTDGDHITKEHTRMQAVCDAGYKPVRVMFYYPNRDQAVRIQRHWRVFTRACKASITTRMPLGST